MSANARPARDPAGHRALRRGVAVVVLLVTAVGWWAFLRPAALGGPLTLVTVAGVSMEPGLSTGDLAVVYEQGSYQPDDVVAFRAEAVPDKPGAYVIHRVVGGSAESGYVTRGDNNDWDDPWHPTADKVTGEMLFSVPGLGTGVRWLAQPVHLAASLAGLASTLVVFAGGRRRTPGPGPDAPTQSSAAATDEARVPA